MSDADRKVIQPRTLKGFRDFLPVAAIAREHLIATAIAVYRSFGFNPIDTPILEYTEILLGKGGDEADKQMYRFDDPGGRDVAMRFDLTVPLARFAAQHIGELGTPFKRYHVGPVWRGENTQRGRYREFVQCDFDTIGTESTMADIETALVIDALFTALGIDGVTIKVNNRKVLQGLLETHSLTGANTAVLRAIDKLPKIGPAAVAEEMAVTAGASSAQIDAVLEFATMSGDVTPADLAGLVSGTEIGERGILELTDLFAGIDASDTSAAFVFDPSIARGLDYYTGVVFETFLDALPEIGSCLSGGRYDDLASVYTKQRLPGVGASLGVDRLLAALEELDLVGGAGTTAAVLVTLFDAEGSRHALQLAGTLRAAGIATEVYPEARKLGAQLKYADRRGHAVAVIAGPNERDAGEVQIKELKTGESITIALDEAVTTIAQILAR